MTDDTKTQTDATEADNSKPKATPKTPKPKAGSSLHTLAVEAMHE